MPGSPEHILITGASGGLGGALASHYASTGRTLSLSGRDSGRLAAICDQCRSSGAMVHGEMLDITDAAAAQAWIEARDDELPVDLVIANAGVGGADVVPSIEGESGALARDIINVNTLGVINTVTPLLSRMVARGAGHLVLVGSISGSIGMPQSPVYCASKAAVQIYGDALRRLLRHTGVRVTNVLPGFVDTTMSRSLDMPRPFCWSAEKAARHIARDVARGKGQSVFPWQLRFAIGLAKVLPVPLADMILSSTSGMGWSNAPEPEAPHDDQSSLG